MATMSKYCKAYVLKDLRAFPGWSEKPGVNRIDIVEEDGKKIEQSRELTEDDYVFVHDNLTVAEGVFVDEGVLYDQITPEWEAFCQTALAFEVPDFEKEHQAHLAAVAAGEATDAVETTA